MKKIIEGQYRKYKMVNVAKLLSFIEGNTKREKQKKLKEILRCLRVGSYWIKYEENLSEKALKAIISNKDNIECLSNKDLITLDNLTLETYWIVFKKDKNNILYEAISEKEYKTMNIVKINTSEIDGIYSVINGDKIKGFTKTHQIIYKNNFLGKTYRHYKYKYI